MAWVISLIAVAYVSYHYRKLVDTVRDFKLEVEKRRKPPEETKSLIVDPADPIYQIQMEERMKMKLLNPDDDL